MKRNLPTIMGLVLTLIGFTSVNSMCDITIENFTNITPLAQQIWGIPSGLMTFFLNVFCFIWALRKHGWKATLRAIATAIAFSRLLRHVPTPMLPDMPSFAKVVVICLCAILSGIGYGLILRADSVTNTNDYFAEMLSLKLDLSRGAAHALLNLALLYVTTRLFDQENLPYSILVTILLSVSINVSFYIKSTKPLPKDLRFIQQLFHLPRNPSLKASQKSAATSANADLSHPVGQILTVRSGDKLITVQILDVTIA